MPTSISERSSTSAAPIRLRDACGDSTRLRPECTTSRERITRKALVEIAQQQKEPRAITFADQRARISRDDRFNLRDVIEQFAQNNHGNVRAVQDYNEGREYDRFEEF